MRWLEDTREGEVELGLLQPGESKEGVIRFRTYGLKSALIDLVSEEEVNLARSYTLQPYQFLWLVQK